MRKAERERIEKDNTINAIVLSLEKEFHYWYIPGNVPSSKNNKTPMPIYKGSRTGKRYIVSCSITEHPNSKIYKETKGGLYYDDGLEFRMKTENKPKPLEVGFFFINNTSHKFDIINKMQIVQDLMVKHGWIDDDNADELIPFFPKINGDHYLTDPKWAGVIILVRK